MAQVEFEELSAVEDGLLKYAVIVSEYRGQWIFCKHRERDTWEIPAGTREPGEAILETARRELWEETGALAYTLSVVGAYCVTRGAKTCGLLCHARVETLGPLPAFEIERIRLWDELPAQLTHPGVQPVLFRRVQAWLAERPGRA